MRKTHDYKELLYNRSKTRFILNSAMKYTPIIIYLYVFCVSLIHNYLEKNKPVLDFWAYCNIAMHLSIFILK